MPVAPFPDGEGDSRPLSVCASRSLLVALATAPDGHADLAAVHDLGIVLPVPRTQFESVASSAFDFLYLAQISDQHLRLRSERKAVMFHGLQHTSCISRPQG